MPALGLVSVLRDETISEFGVDPAGLSIGAHDRVRVKCNRCGEKFTREYRHKHQSHRCATHVNHGGKLLPQQKWCAGCETYLSYTSFPANNARFDQLGVYCEDCIHNIGVNKTSADIDALINRTIKDLSCDNQSNASLVSRWMIHDQWRKQGAKCYFTDLDLYCGTDSPYSAILVKLQPDLGYIEGNVIWVSAVVEHARNGCCDGELLELLSLIKSGISSTPVRLECKLLLDGATVPTRNRATDAGYDLYAADDVIVPAGGAASVPTGIALAAPPDYYYTIEGRSGLGMKHITPFRGIIDGTYCGELIVNLRNGGISHYRVNAGDRIAQICLHKIEHADITVVDDFSKTYNQRGTAGFGSSGV